MSNSKQLSERELEREKEKIAYQKTMYAGLIVFKIACGTLLSLTTLTTGVGIYFLSIKNNFKKQSIAITRKPANKSQVDSSTVFTPKP